MSFKSLINCFEQIQNKPEQYSISSNGEQFESLFHNLIKGEGFSEIVSKNKQIEIPRLEKISKNNYYKLWKQIKDGVLQKNSIEVVKNPFKNIRKNYLFQPFGKQNYPDFLVFCDDFLIPIEIKYSTKITANLDSTRPMWNSNLPKPNGLYIYGVSRQDVTFFKGDDIISYKTRQILLDYWNKTDSFKEELNSNLKEQNNNFGFYPYNRKAYENKKDFSTFVDENGNKKIESFFGKNRNIREQNVLQFLKDLLE